MSYYTWDCPTGLETKIQSQAALKKTNLNQNATPKKKNKTNGTQNYIENKQNKVGD